jgi:SPX domain protein involved in polyphosphate accumulation
MVKFGKILRKNILNQWEEKYIDYKSLKHFIKTNKNSCKLKKYFITLLYSK